MLETLIKRAEDKIERAMDYAMKVKSPKDKTDILNAQYYMGQFHAYMNLIEITDIDKYVEIGKRTKEMRQFILEVVDKFYR